MKYVKDLHFEIEYQIVLFHMKSVKDLQFEI